MQTVAQPALDNLRCWHPNDNHSTRHTTRHAAGGWMPVSPQRTTAKWTTDRDTEERRGCRQV
ncbi:hypothetical protein BC831DRAFT_463595, partial [Entophlyctis helioformis]